MMKMWLVLTLLSFTALAEDQVPAKACDIKTYSQIILTQKKSAKDFANEIIRETNCDQATTTAFINTIIGAEGDLRAEHLSALLEEQNIHQEINLEPTKITVNKLENIIRERAIIGSGFELSNIQFVGLEGTIALSEQDRLKVECINCELLGEQNLKISVVNPISTENKLFWARTSVMRKIKVWKVKEDISSMTESGITNQLELVEMAVNKPENYLNDNQDLKFYKVNRSLRRGDLVKQTDVSPLVLIKSGNRVKIKVSNGNLNLAASGVANKSGSFGDSIEITNLNSKKKFVGRIVDYNTVVIDL